LGSFVVVVVVAAVGRRWWRVRGFVCEREGAGRGVGRQRNRKKDIRKK